MQLANPLRHLMVAILFTLTGGSLAQAQAWLERAECSPFIAVNPEHPETTAYLLQFVTEEGDSAQINIDAFIASVNPAEKARTCGFAQPGSNESYVRLLRTNNAGLESTMSFNDFAGWMNKNDWRIRYWPLSATDVAAWDRAAPRRTAVAQQSAPTPAPAASAPAATRQAASVSQGLTRAQVRTMIEAAIPAAPVALTEGQLEQVADLLGQNFAGFGEGMSKRLTEILAGYAKQEEVAAFAERLETVAAGLAAHSDRLTAIEEQQFINALNAAVAQATADVALGGVKDLEFRTADLERVSEDLGRGQETLAAEAEANRAASDTRFGAVEGRLGAVETRLANKADQSFVQTELDKKADATAVNDRFNAVEGNLSVIGFPLKTVGAITAVILLALLAGGFFTLRRQIGGVKRTAVQALTLAHEAKVVAAQAMVRADLALSMVFDGVKFIGDVPTQPHFDALGPGQYQSITISVGGQTANLKLYREGDKFFLLGTTSRARVEVTDAKSLTGTLARLCAKANREGFAAAFESYPRAA